MIKKLSSRWLTAALLIAITGSYIYFTSGENPYERWINFLLGTKAGMALYAVLMLNIFFVSIGAAFSKIKRTESIEEMDTFFNIPARKDITGETLGEWVGSFGFKKAQSMNNAVCAQKGKFSFLPGTIMRAGIILFSASLLLSFHLRKTDEKILHEGDSFGEGIRLAGTEAGIPGEFLQVGEKSAFCLSDVKALISYKDKTYAVSSGYPSKVGGRYLRISHLGFSQQVIVEGSSFRLVKEADLDVLPPGKTSVMPIEQSGGMISFTLKPEKTITKGLLTGKLYGLDSPFYSVVIQSKGKTDYIDIKPSESKTGGGFKVAFGKSSLYIKMQSVYDPALFFIYSGLLVTFAGALLMLSRFFWYEKRICALITGNSVLAGYSEEFYRKWGILRFHKKKEELLSCPESAIEKADSSG